MPTKFTKNKTLDSSPNLIQISDVTRTPEEVFAEIRALPKLEYTAEEAAAIKAGGRITESARWDCASPTQRAIMRPDLNPNKRWYEQKAWQIPRP